MTILTKGKRKKKMRHSREKEDFGRINASTLGRGDLTNHSCEWKQDCSEGGLKGIGSKARKVLAKLWRVWIPMWIEEAGELMRHLTNTNLAKIGAKD